MPVGVLSLPLGSVLTGQPEVIGSSVLAGAAASVSFQFPPVYRAVLVEMWSKWTSAATLRMTLNNDGGANYAYQGIDVGSTFITGVRSTGQTSFGQRAATGSANGPSHNSLMVVKTTAAVRAQITQIIATDVAASITLNLVGGEWNNTTDLLSRIDLFPSAGNLAANTSITCWGFRR